MQSLIVSKNEAGQRLDKLLSKYLNLAEKSFLYKMMRKKNITLNGRKCEGSEKLAEGDEVKLFLSDETIEKFSQLKLQEVKKVSLNIIYEDEHILLVNKPAGMLSQKAKESDESLVEYMIDYLVSGGQLSTEQLRSFRPSVCNRLDRNTSGLVVCGKSLPGLQLMSASFKDRSIHKYYQCVVKGQISDKQVITGYLTKSEATNQVTVHIQEVPGSAPIETEYEPVKWHEGYTLLKVTLITGRTHQIRAHLSSIGHPIVGDYKYGDSRVNEEAKKLYHIQSQLLHSYQVTFPELAEPLAYLSGRTFYAPLPKTFSKICRDWR
ncbi:23S rRNA pseudouridine955/2504/2580 synthase [Lacrimispora sphenoides]|jgi:23S rRNA pseudouridine955/2504/2580 synthase|uniref:RluA family pseudouridine synthase n=1 Tax=Lacrimispora sphenoides TaxID=29370 RepID=UPI0008D3695A|nr:RluA family pseudouridine synthase [Lacrimispora sphenoides]SEU29698.1 23S rRNA pseudouridine955/2504/2580 synthase [Lacrimispora sphenoides]